MYHKKDVHAAVSKFKLLFKLMSYKYTCISYYVLSSINCSGRVRQCSGLLSEPGRLADFDNSRTRPTMLAVGAAGFIWIFLLTTIFSLFFLPLYGKRGPRYTEILSERAVIPPTKIHLIVDCSIKNQILMCNDKNNENTSFAVERNCLIWKCGDILRSTTPFLLYSQPSW